MKNFDVIVVGGGHAGIEAALSVARRGLKCLMITSNIERIGYMSCNPAIGGLAKGHMVREIDALGGQMGSTTDWSCIQFKRLNSAKGPAVRGSRAQCDKDKYSERMKALIRGQSLLEVSESEVKSILLDGQICSGVILEDGVRVSSRAVIITTGTFMNGVMHVGETRSEGGRAGDKPSIGLSDQLKALGFKVRRLKTGTPPRLKRASIDFSRTVEQFGDERVYPFSFRSAKSWRLPQVTCYLSYTSERTHDIIRENLDKSPMYCGLIEGIGPRYCPSIEDKVVRFSDKNKHQTFLEPEGLDTDLIYLQGISTSLPADIQDQFLRTIAGLERVEVARYGYAVEYDFIDSTQLKPSLESKEYKGLFFAGQVNGTSGYEEAAAQGFIAGVNSVNFCSEQAPLILGRDQAYIGVLIDDLVTKGTSEPYRMFTSRAEHRLVLREDNTVDRLLGTSESLGLLSAADLGHFMCLEEKKRRFKESLRGCVYPNVKTNTVLVSMGTAAIRKPVSYEILLRRPEVNFSHLECLGLVADCDTEVLESAEIEVKYAGYIAKQNDVIAMHKKLEEERIPDEISYELVVGLSLEDREKLRQIRPFTLGQAERIPGVSPAAIQVLAIYLRGWLGGGRAASWQRKLKISKGNGELGSGLAT